MNWSILPRREVVDEGALFVTDEADSRCRQPFMGTDDEKATRRQGLDDATNGRIEQGLAVIGEEIIAQQDDMEPLCWRLLDQIVLPPDDVFLVMNADGKGVFPYPAEGRLNIFRRELLEAAFLIDTVAGTLEADRLGIACEYLQGSRQSQPVPEDSEAVGFLTAGAAS